MLRTTRPTGYQLVAEITLVLLLAAVTRIINVSSWPVWTDEGWTIWAVQTTISARWLTRWRMTAIHQLIL